MTNCQLYHTNVYLGGQMKYDLVLSPHGSDLIVSDFHITPISPFIPFNKYEKENLLNYTHQENIKKFYKQISGSFHEQNINPILESLYPIQSDYNGKLYDDTYEMGCRRMSYKLYNRQFEFLCPLWIEGLSENQYLNFEFEVYLNEKDETPISTKNVILKKYSNCNYHNKFVDYLNNYMTYIGIKKEEESDENDKREGVFNIDPITQTSTVTGFNVESGIVMTKQLPHLLNNLFRREIPLIEFDNTIIESLRNNKLITKHLFNFNLCFNPEYLIPKYLLNEMSCHPFVVKLKVAMEKIESKDGSDGITTVLLETRDLYSNYEYIPKKYCDEKAIHIFKDGVVKDVTDDWKKELLGLGVDGPTPEEPNVLDYLKDYNCIDYVQKNKMSQPIIHWSLIDNNDYIFNVYNGFGGYHIDHEDNKYKYTNHKYDNAHNLISNSDYELSQNTNCWCNSIIINPFLPTQDTDEKNNSTNYLSIIHTEQLSSYFSRFSEGVWNNGVKYLETSLKNNSNSTDNDGITSVITSVDMLILGCPLNTVNLTAFLQSNGVQIITGNNVKYIILNKVNGKISVIFIITGKDRENTIDNMRKFTFQDALNNLKSKPTDVATNATTEDVKTILNLLNSLKSDTKVFTPSCSLDLRRIEGLSLDISEIFYSKNHNKGDYVERYFGKIVPTFINPKSDIDYNFKYFRKKLSDEEKTKIIKYSKQLKEPIYPSTGYFFMDKYREEYDNKSYTENTEKEINSFNFNIIRNLRTEFNWILTQEPVNGKYKTIRELVREELGKYYKLEGDEHSDLLNYIESLYDCNSSFDYVDPRNIRTYKYMIKLTLK